ncbi:hypothetical protein HK096_008405, partial [Nowakowskiella sp. JEL0078]
RLNTPQSTPRVNDAVSGPSSSVHPNYQTERPDPPTFHIQMFPHTEAISLQGTHTGFNFSPVEKHIKVGTTIKIGRKVEKDPNRLKNQKKKSSIGGGAVGGVGEERQLTDGNMSDVYGDVVGGDESRDGAEPMELDVSGPSTRTEVVKQDFIAFRSKVVSRTHAEMWVGDDNQ